MIPIIPRWTGRNVKDWQELLVKNDDEVYQTKKITLFDQDDGAKPMRLITWVLFASCVPGVATRK